MPSGGRRETAIDFATHTVFGDELSSQETTEVVDTLRELVEYFGAPAILKAVSDLGISAKSEDGNEKTLQTLRAYSLLLLESNKPGLVAKIVGYKIAKLEQATGKRICLKEIGREWGVSKQAVSKRIASMADRLGVPRPDSTESARTSHRLMNRRNYAHGTTNPDS